MTVPNRHGDLSTPSVVLFEDDGLIVGKEAQRMALLEPDRVAECAKRDIGLPNYHRLVAGRQVQPQVISALILKRLKADAQRRVGAIRQAVITVPALFRPHSPRGDVRGGSPGRPGGCGPAKRALRGGACVRISGGLSRCVRSADGPEDPASGRDDGRRLRSGRRNV